jgi:hypothetical protein
MPHSKNPLDLLFQDIQRDLDREAQAKKHSRQSPVQSTYANPLNWTLGKVIRLVHHEAGALGSFQEYFHKLSPTARRLMPCDQSLPIDRDEMVWGEFWLHPKFQTPQSDSEAEVHAIESRFYELMSLEDEFE